MRLKSILSLLLVFQCLVGEFCCGSVWAGGGKKETTKSRLIAGEINLACADARAAECRGDFEIADRRWWDGVRLAEKMRLDESLLADALYGQSQFYARTAEYDKAATALKRFIRLKRNNREKTYFYLAFHDWEMAELYFHQEKWQDAAELYLDISRVWKEARRWPTLIPVLDRLGLCFQRLGKKSDAEQNFREALAAWKKARQLQGLESERRLMDFCAAQTMEDFGAFLAECGKIAESKQLKSESAAVWNGLNADPAVLAEEKLAPNQAEFVTAVLRRSKLAVSPEQLKKIALAEKLAFSFCREGRYFEAETFYDIILSSLAEPLKTDRSDEQTIRHQVLIAICQSQRARSQVDPPYSAKQRAGGRTYDNPYLVEFNKLRSREDFLSKRTELVSKFAYAVPTSEGLAVLQQFQPILEIGAGTGYWAACLRKAGTKIVAYELFPLSLGKNAWHPQATRSWTEVLRGDESLSAKYPERTLFMSYPPGRTRVAYNALKGFKGNRLVYVGETAGVAPGSGQDEFQALLAKDWQLEKLIHQPQWPGLYDCLFVYKRKSNRSPIKANDGRKS